MATLATNLETELTTARPAVTEMCIRSLIATSGPTQPDDYRQGTTIRGTTTRATIFSAKETMPSQEATTNTMTGTIIRPVTLFKYPENRDILFESVTREILLSNARIAKEGPNRPITV